MKLTHPAGTATTPITATRDTARPSDRVRVTVTRFVVTALALASPALAFGQAAPPEGGATVSPVQAIPGVGNTGAALPGATLPGETPTGLASQPAELVRYGIAAGVGETDNVNLSSTNPKSQTIAATNLDFDLKRTGSRLDASGLGNFTDLYYLQGAYGNQVLGRFDGLATAKLWSDRLRWIVADDYGEQQANPFAAITPVNLERVNIFTTGPGLTLRPSYSTFINLDARYSQSSYQRSPFDGHSFIGAAEFGRQLTPLSSVSLAVQAEKLRFDNTTVNTDYDRRQAYGRYVIKGARSAIDAQLGVTQANDVNRSWKTTPFAHLVLTRRISPFSIVTLAGGREFTDAAGSFSNLSSGAGGGIVVAPVSQTTANYLRNYGSAGWVFSRLRTSVALTGNWERDTYDMQPLYNANRADLGLNLGRALTPRLSLNVTVSGARYEYVNQGFTDEFGTVGGGLVYQPGRWVVVYARYDHSFRRSSGTPGLVFGADRYDENRVFIMIGYRPHSVTEGTGAAGESGPGRAPAP